MRRGCHSAWRAWWALQRLGAEHAAEVRAEHDRRLSERTERESAILRETHERRVREHRGG